MPRMMLMVALWAWLAFTSALDPEPKQQRDERILSLFNVVQFKNEPCAGSASRNGTCYTSQECANRNGVSSGSCASGYGVCCVFTLNCGASSSENNTYFESTGSELGACRVSICPCNANICQLRLDFSTFLITGPSTSTVIVGKTLGGVQLKMGESDVSTATQCLTDTFSVTNPGGTAPPVICGSNNMAHMYVDASASCNDLIFQLRPNQMPGAGGAAANRRWSIRITQFSCDYENLAPSGCTQYYFGEGKVTDTVKSFNFDGNVHLADQRQNICVRRERGTCRICWWAPVKTDFVLSGKTTKKSGFNKGDACCGYGADGKAMDGFDCVIIPGAAKDTVNKAMVGQDICGRSNGLATVDAMGDKTVCSSRVPFNLLFLSDHFEFSGAMSEALNPGKGFRLSYSLRQC